VACETICTFFYVFYVFFQNQKKNMTFYVFLSCCTRFPEQWPRAYLEDVSEINGDISRKLQIFPTPCMNHTANGFLLNFWRWWDTKTVMIPLPECQKVWLYVHFYRHILTLGRRTDGIGKTISCSACIVCWCAITVTIIFSTLICLFILQLLWRCYLY